MVKDIIKGVNSRLNAKKEKYNLISHKKGWLKFLADGNLGFMPGDLHRILREVINEFPPNGNKLLHQRKRYNFTVTVEKKAYRPEEALERFITTSNSGKFYNQVPIGGKKESVDIGIEENESKFVFVELKPWTSTNSPLYAIVESLKNLIEYRIIHENGITHHKDCKHYENINLIILAPQSYYQDYGLTEEAQDKISKVEKALNDLSREFRTNISLMALTLKEENFLDKLGKICEEQKVEKLQSISITKKDAISELARGKWKLLVSSEMK
ncbi:MAG: hypothetical protein JW976_13975 [Syntrophaceae bacterium]|nr:hypothetical protein [Syntrophaceae bacterium]